MGASSPGDFEKLSVAEQILVLQDLWDRIAARSEQVEVTEAQRLELDRRLSAHQAEPDLAVAWDEVARRIRAGR